MSSTWPFPSRARPFRQLRLPTAVNDRFPSTSAFVFLWTRYSASSSAALICRLTEFAALCVWSAWVGGTLSGNPVIWAPTWWTSAFEPALLFLLVTATSRFAGLVNDLRFRRVLYRDIETRLSLERAELDSRKSSLVPSTDHRATGIADLARDLSSAIDIAYTPAAILIGTAWIVWIDQSSSGAVLATAATLVASLALSQWLARWRSALALPLSNAIQRRRSLTRCWFTPGAPAKKAGDDYEAMTELLEATATEIELRSQRGLIDGVDARLQTIAITLPALAAPIVILTTATLGYQAPFDILAFSWAVLPLVCVALRASNALPRLDRASSALKRISTMHIAKDDPDVQACRIFWNESWRLFDGTLQANIDPDGSSRQTAMFLMNHLRLTEQLGSATFVILHGGRNLSPDQQYRVLFARAALRASTTRLPLTIDVPQPALDANAQAHLESAVAAMNISVAWGRRGVSISRVPTSHGSISRTIAKGDAASSKEYPAKPHVLLLDVAARSGWLLATLIIAAAAVPGMSILLSAFDRHSGWPFVAAMVGLCAVTLALALRTGYRIEHAIRAEGLERHVAALAARHPAAEAEAGSPGEGTATQARIEAAFDVVMGRLPFRFNALAWLCACIVVAATAMLITLQIAGAMLLAATCLAIAVVWSRAHPIVETNREESATSMARYYAASDNLSRLDGLSTLASTHLRRQFLKSAFDALWNAQRHAVASHALLRESWAAIAVILIAAVLVIAPLVGLAIGPAVFTVAAVTAATSAVNWLFESPS